MSNTGKSGLTTSYISVWNRFHALFRAGFNEFNSKYRYFPDADMSPAINDDVEDPEWADRSDAAMSFDIPKEFTNPVTNIIFDEKRTKELRMRIMAFNYSLSYCFGINKETGRFRLYPYMSAEYDEYIIIAYNELSKMLTDTVNIMKFSPSEGRSIVDSLFLFKYESYKHACVHYLNWISRFEDIDDEHRPEIQDTHISLPTRTSLDAVKNAYEIVGNGTNGYRWFINALHNLICDDYDRRLTMTLEGSIKEKLYVIRDAKDLYCFVRHVAGYFEDNIWLDKELELLFKDYPRYAHRIPMMYSVRTWVTLKESIATAKKKALTCADAISFEDCVRAVLLSKKRIPYPNDYFDILLSMARSDEHDKVISVRDNVLSSGDDNGVIEQSTWSGSLKRAREKIESHKDQVMN